MNLESFYSLGLFLSAVALERWLPLSTIYHPLTAFKVILRNLKKRVNRKHNSSFQQRLAGLLSVLVVQIPAVALLYATLAFAALPDVFSAVLLYISLSSKPLEKDLLRINRLLKTGHKSVSKEIIAQWLARDTGNLSEAGICKASIETLALRTFRHYLMVLLCFMLGGGITAFSYRLLTLMTENWRAPGSTSEYAVPASKILQVLDYLPIRVTTFLLASIYGLKRFTKYTRLYTGIKSIPDNSSFVICCYSTALKIQLGGPAYFTGVKHVRPRISTQRLPNIEDIQLSLTFTSHLRTLALCIIIFPWVVTLGVSN